MAARRQSSTTSLSKYARVNSPDLSNRSLDFCNAFWGAADGGVDVLFARMRGAARTIDELRAFWKERAAIEEEYAKRLSKLAKQPLGRDEIGELKNSLDTLRLETDKQATAHAQLAHQVHTELESPAGAFTARQAQFKRGAQSVIEKAFKNKQTQESYVTKAREKYEADCMRINSYMAQSTLVQGKDLEKIQLKLDRARQTVTANEKDFANFARALQGTVEKWERDWKAFCDACQDLEEERIEFMKDNVWAYANAVSTVCVSDDESCEKIRLSLEQLEPDRDMENFVRDYGTGNEVPDPPKFISYSDPDAAIVASSRQAPRYASYPRVSNRHLSMGEVLRAMPQDQEPTDAGMAGFGAGGSGTGRNGDLERSNTTATQSRSIASSSPVNGTGTSAPTTPSTVLTSAHTRSQSQAGPSSASDPSTQKTMLAVGGGVYEVYPDQDPQNVVNSTGPSSGTGPTSSRVGGGDDPLLKQMAELRNSAAATGSIRRNSVNAQRPSSAQQSVSPAPSAGASGPAPGGSAGSALAAPVPKTAQPANRDYRNSAEMVVGGPPPGSRPTSPAGPPTAAHMIPPAQVSTSSLPVEDVVSSYAPALPGERRTPISRGNSPGIVGPSHGHSQSLGQNINNQRPSLERPKSREGFAGIGSGGRSPSPGPAPGPSGSAYVNGSQNNYRLPSPVSGPGADLGISLDASGQVTHDRMAEQYRQPPPPAQQQALPPQPPAPRGQYGPLQRNQSMHVASPVGPPPPQQQPPYGGPPPPHGQYIPQQLPYGQPAPPPPSAQGLSPGVQRQPSLWYHQQQQQQQQIPQHQQPPPPQQQQQPQYIPPPPQQQQGQQPMNSYAPNGANLHRGPSMNMHPPPAPAHSNGLGYQNTGYFDQHVRRSPSPQPPPGMAAPTGQFINGRPILFYVKALYDYQATIDEEFDFTAGDVIAVTSTPEDGWWTGELLDDSRRVPGRTVFPSNFVCLF
ncbi:uncharacterized protein FOMMEDRAFT_116643 [Fomitiporia mediterranea MF3/22]|uniref:uncharacterized protein n=1 Tax=Fomitiporia mediterranea (strain MF3/22) TaxID=694068 RepID=UPI0004407852|nr:uncharacterized protein FOMMEDRAFT_116643 [Fomitiporia mediterranea MF3/22]EJD08179.1 hypothetical protein FOMMEDRAFT_116643 [Fomitiporia mediterranea MF3/22]